MYLACRNLKDTMKRQLLLFVVCIPFLSSCFELREEVFIHKEGWGNFKLIADFSENKEVFRDLVAKADTSKHNPFGKPGNSFQELLEVWGLGAEKLSHLNGIRTAKQIFDREQFLIGLQFDFEDINALNLALTLRDGGEFNPSYSLPYNYEKGKFTKNKIFIFQKLLKYLNQSNKEDVRFNNQKKAIFAQISYTTIIKTSGKIKKFTNYHFKLADDQQQLKASFPLSHIMSGAIDLSNLVKFK